MTGDKIPQPFFIHLIGVDLTQKEPTNYRITVNPDYIATMERSKKNVTVLKMCYGDIISVLQTPPDIEEMIYLQNHEMTDNEKARYLCLSKIVDIKIDAEMGLEDGKQP